MTEKFEEIFWEVVEEKNIHGYWVLLDSEDFKEIENRISQKFGDSIFKDIDFLNWYKPLKILHQKIF